LGESRAFLTLVNGGAGAMIELRCPHCNKLWAMDLDGILTLKCRCGNVVVFDRRSAVLVR